MGSYVGYLYVADNREVKGVFSLTYYEGRPREDRFLLVGPRFGDGLWDLGREESDWVRYRSGFHGPQQAADFILRDNQRRWSVCLRYRARRGVARPSLALPGTRKRHAARGRV